MRASAHPANQLSYLRLVYHVFFCLWDRFPSVVSSRERITVLWRALSMAVFASSAASIVALFMTWQGDLPRILLHALVGAAFAALIGTVGSVVFGPASGTSSAVLFGLTSAIGLVIAALDRGSGFPLAFAFVVAATTGFGSSLASGALLGAVGGLAFAGSFGVMVSMMSTVAVSDWLAWPGMLIAAPLVIFLSFWAIVIVAYLPGSFLQRRVHLHTAHMHWWLSVAAVAVVGAIVAYTYTALLPGLWPETSPAWAIAVVFVASYYRAPLWPLEAIWAVRGLARIQETKEAEVALYAIRRAYFDRSMLLPLPGEATALRHLAELDFDLGTDQAIHIVLESNHLLAGIAVLQDCGAADPLRVHQLIRGTDTTSEKIDLLLRYVKSDLSPAADAAWRAMDDVFRLDEQLAAPPSAASMRTSLDGLGNTVADLGTALELDPQLPHIGTVLAVYSSLLSVIKCRSIDQLAGYRKPVLPPGLVAHLPDHLDSVLFDLSELAATIRAHIEASSPITRRNALLRASERLESITVNSASVPGAIGHVLALVSMRWRQLLANAGGALVEEDVGRPFVNPYVAGNPVSGELFVGREDILRQLEALWADEEHSSSVILYGHRRMGKTSILRNLGARFGGHTVVVDFNLQRIGPVNSTGELLYVFALALYDRLCEEGSAPLSEPVEDLFIEHNPYTALNRYLDHVNRGRRGRRIVIAVDEFELIETGIKAGTLQAGLLAYWRGLIQTHTWLVIAFAGLHTLREMTQNYWHPLFSSVTAIPVSYLSDDAARRLIRQPTADFSVDYDSEAVEMILHLTNGQPYLVQHLGRSLVARLNQQLFEEGIERSPRLTCADVAEVIESPEFYRDANAYFTGVWQQAASTLPQDQTCLLTLLAAHERGMSTVEVARCTGFSLARAESILQALKRHDVVELRGAEWHLSVELMRFWLLRQQVVESSPGLKGAADRHSEGGCD